jgi:hypothetical protein
MHLQRDVVTCYETDCLVCVCSRLDFARPGARVQCGARGSEQDRGAGLPFVLVRACRGYGCRLQRWERRRWMCSLNCGWIHHFPGPWAGIFRYVQAAQRQNETLSRIKGVQNRRGAFEARNEMCNLQCLGPGYSRRHDKFSSTTCTTTWQLTCL